MNVVESMGHERDPRVGKQVLDIASHCQGELTAIVQEKVSGYGDSARYRRLAFIKASNGIEWSTLPENLELAP